MSTTENVLLSLELVLLLIHEMDAIRRKEWRMFIGLNKMTDENAYRLFTGIHFPLYLFLLFSIFGEFHQSWICFLDIFLVCHLAVHFCFRKHPANRFYNWFSVSLIIWLGVVALIHLILF